jgi:hypothetical protein
MIGELDGRNKNKKRHSPNTAKVFRKRQRSKALPSLSKEDILKWLQNVKVRRSSKESSRQSDALEPN